MRIKAVYFTHPVAVPDTHLRQATFSHLDGWEIERHGGVFRLTRGNSEFWVDAPSSWTEIEVEAVDELQASEPNEAASDEVAKKRGRPKKAAVTTG